MKHTRYAPQFLLTLLVALPTSAQAQNLYNGALGTPLTSQGWTLTSLPTGAGVQTNDPTEQTTTLTTVGQDTAANNASYSGYTRLDQTLSSTGFVLDFNLRINSETHDGINGPNRAGVSLIVLNENKRGVELGFWTPQTPVQPTIQVQDLIANAFVFDPTERAFSTTTLLSAYTLTFTNNTYTLTAGNTTLMTGNLRDYTSYTGTGAGVYQTANFLFLGDDTTSARGSLSLKSANLSPTATAVAPEPGTLCLLTLGILTTGIKACRLKRLS